MGKCDNCGKKILYNKYKRYRKQILCRECYDTRLERKKAAKEVLKAQAEALKIVTPKKRGKKAKKEPKDEEESNVPSVFLDDDDETAKTAEDNRL